MHFIDIGANLTHESFDHDRDAVLRRRDAGLESRLLQFRLRDPAPLLFHNEPILQDGGVVGRISSGAYGHWLGGAVGLGYVPCRPDETAAGMLERSYAVDVAGTVHEAEVSLRPMYDPTGARMRG